MSSEKPMPQLEQILLQADQFDTCMVLISNRIKNYVDAYKNYDIITATGCEKSIQANKQAHFFNDLHSFINESKTWCFGHFNYDLKNQLEKLTSENDDRTGIDDGFFFIPENISVFKNGKEEKIKQKNPLKTPGNKIGIHPEYSAIRQKISKKEYIEKVNKIKGHIHRGDIFEINFCYEYFIEDVKIDPISVFLSINKISPMPFAGFYKHNNRYLLCFSPERFLQKKGKNVISQPMKGTIARGKNPVDDERLKKELKNSKKETGENIMITDLVRNDLSRCAEQGSVKVEELCGIYAFNAVYQMISTISAIMHKNTTAIDVIKNAFPMGSMTGAPKVRAMQLIEEFEESKRGIYSGSIGYFTPDQDFDFNVVIRSMVYNPEKNYLNFMVGSAITSLSDAEKEYDECELKAKAFFEWLHLKKI